MFGKVEFFQKVFDQFRVFAGDVGGLPDVFLEVVEGELFDVGAVIFGDVGLPDLSLFGPVEIRMRKVEIPINLMYRPQDQV